MDESIETVARAIYYRDQAPPAIGWDDVRPDVRAYYRDLAGAAIEAIKREQPKWVTKYEKALLSDVGPAGGEPTEN